MTMKVVISNVYADDNRGGAAITSAAIDIVQRTFPGCTVTLVAVGDDAGRIPETHRHTLRDHPDVEIVSAAVPALRGPLPAARAAGRALWWLVAPRRASTPAIRAVREADLVLGKGGQAFRVRSGMSGALALWLAMFPLLYAKRLGIPAAVYGVTVGPFEKHGGSRILTGWILRRLDLVFVRDALSYREAGKLGVKRHRRVAVPDSVLAMEPPSMDAVASIRTRLGLTGASFGAVTVNRPGPRDSAPLYGYLEAVLRPLLDDGLVDRVLVVVQTDGSVKSDRGSSQAFVDHMDDPRVTLLHEDLSARDLCALYSAASFTVGGRIHSAILSLVGGTPAYPLLRERGRKADSIFRSVGLEDDVVRLDRPAEHYAARIAEAVAAGEQRRATVRATVASARDTTWREVPMRLRGLIPVPQADSASKAVPV